MANTIYLDIKHYVLCLMEYSPLFSSMSLFNKFIFSSVNLLFVRVINFLKVSQSRGSLFLYMMLCHVMVAAVTVMVFFPVTFLILEKKDC